LSMNFLIS